MAWSCSVCALLALSLVQFCGDATPTTGPFQDHPSFKMMTTACVSASQSLQSVVNSTWQINPHFMSPIRIAEGLSVTMGVMLLLVTTSVWIVMGTYCILSAIVACIQPYPPLYHLQEDNNHQKGIKVRVKEMYRSWITVLKKLTRMCNQTYRNFSRNMQLVCMQRSGKREGIIAPDQLCHIKNSDTPDVKSSYLHKGYTKTLFVHLPHGEVVVAQLPETATAKAIKSIIEAKCGVHANKQELHYNTKWLPDNHSIKLLPDDANIYLLHRLHGGGVNCHICDDPGEYVCNDCNNQVTCADCCKRVHKHPNRVQHNYTSCNETNDSLLTSDTLCTTTTHNAPALLQPTASPCNPTAHNLVSAANHEEEYDSDGFPNSPSFDTALSQSMKIATLAQRFHLTAFNNFQSTIIDATLSCRDTVVVQPTGSGKSLCYQFPPVYEQKKAVVVTATISLMQDQVKNLQDKGIQAIFLGSAQLDRMAEQRAFSCENQVSIIYVTPEWLSKPENKHRLNLLSSNGKLSLIAIDEAHLFYYWQEFREAYKNLENLKNEFPTTPIMVLTATAPPEVKSNILKLVRNPVISHGTVNRQNVYLRCEELPSGTDKHDFHYFSSRVADMVKNDCAVIYTDFIENIAFIISELSGFGIDCVAYNGKMDPKSRYESYLRWKSGEAQIMVATSAFGLGIDHPGIRHIIRYGVPENLCSWVQELGRAGRDGNPATATVYYSLSNTEHAGVWIKDHLRNQQFCKQILQDFSKSWKFVWAHLAGKCRREILMDAFQDPCEINSGNAACCDVCEQASVKEMEAMVDNAEELQILISTIDVIGEKGEKKIAQWIRGSSLEWTDNFDKSSSSYGNFKGHSEGWWRTFMRQCHVKGFVDRQLKSMIKKSGHYTVLGTYQVTTTGRQTVANNIPLLLPCVSSEAETSSSSGAASSGACFSLGHDEKKKERQGRGTHSIICLRKLMADKENWIEIQTKEDYQYPGVFSRKQFQVVYYTSDYTKFTASGHKDPHFMWSDIQLSKDKMNIHTTTMEIAGKSEVITYRSAPCNGVKVCPVPGCSHIVPIRDQRPCKKHPKEQLQKTNTKDSKCPVQFAYIYPKNFQEDKRRWILGFVRQQKLATDNLHNHPLHSASHFLKQSVEDITAATKLNPSLKPTDVAKGKALGYVLGTVDKAGVHLGRISNVMKRAKMSSHQEQDWDVTSFETIADKVDTEEQQRSRATKEEVANIRELSRPYLVSAGIENGIKYVLTMNPLQTRVLSQAEFIETDITFKETTEYPYLFNAVAFNDKTLEWMVVARVRMNKQNEHAHALAFKKIFQKCQQDHQEFKVGSTLIGIVTDWSDAEIAGLKNAVGDDVASKVLKGCQVHWTRSWQRVRDRILSSNDKPLERAIFSKIAATISKLAVGQQVARAFEVLCSKKSAHVLVGVIKSLKAEEAEFVDKNCDWSRAQHWVNWWTRPQHLQMLHQDFTQMAAQTWSRCPSDTNAVERKNQDSKASQPVSIQQAMINLYTADKYICTKQLAAEAGVSVSYRDLSEEGRRSSAALRKKQRLSAAKSPDDSAAQFGPPDKQQHFENAKKRKRAKTSKQGAAAAPKSKKAKIIVNDGDDDFEVGSDSTKRTHTPKDGTSEATASGASNSCGNTHGLAQAVIFKPPDATLFGKNVQMKFHIEESGEEEWFDGVISGYNGMTGEYGVFFPCDDQTIYVNPNDPDLKIM